MLVRRARVRGFRNLEAAEVELGESVTIVSGPNGAGKTNLLEGALLRLHARSCRTANEREVVRQGEKVARVVLETRARTAAIASRSASRRASRSGSGWTARPPSALTGPRRGRW